MEPSSVEDGNHGIEILNDREAAASMEPSSVEDGNPRKIGGMAETTAQLQWSRPQLRTETQLPHYDILAVPLASMEPSSVEDGNSSD